MQYILENEDQLQGLSTLTHKKVFCKIIEGSNRIHPRLNNTLALYLHFEDQPDGIILNIGHPDALCLSKDKIEQALSKFDKVYVLDKKHFLYHFSLKNLVDIQLINTLENFDKLILPAPTKVHNWYYSQYGDRRDINKIIPLSKHYEHAEEVYYRIKEFFNNELDQGFHFFNNIASAVFFLIENEGLGILEEDFIKAFNLEFPEANVYGGTVYTYYNLYNYTSRPTNAYNGINFAAIAHQTDHRRTIVPKHDEFIEIDFDGYHIRLVADLIGYTLDSTSAHRQLGKLYFNKESLSDQEYENTKQINFQAIYGKTPEQYKHLEFFTKLEQYINEVWKTFQDKGQVVVPISNKKFTKKLEGIYPKKLFNYILQALETANNICILKEVLRYLRDKKTKIALYTYDSVVVDLSLKDGKEVLNDILKIMEKGGKFPVKWKAGKDLFL